MPFCTDTHFNLPSSSVGEIPTSGAPPEVWVSQPFKMTHVAAWTIDCSSQVPTGGEQHKIECEAGQENNCDTGGLYQSHFNVTAQRVWKRLPEDTRLEVFRQGTSQVCLGFPIGDMLT